ncbi:TIGR02588 family protein [Aliinostoc sp. HNIBRCY26]|uniref:TIGR02588 family protein n=1 Tax=Aliinostoc sp. HNIBRCY26 TaxID=3418997 RepID=UPI003D089EEF
MNQSESEAERTPAEWITLSIALFILAIIVSLVGYIWINEKDQPPIISVNKKQTIRRVNGQFYVPFEVVNSGGETAESVQIIATLKVSSQVEETGEQQIDFLSGGEREEGAFVFNHNPQSGELNIRIASYKLP